MPGSTFDPVAEPNQTVDCTDSTTDIRHTTTVINKGLDERGKKLSNRMNEVEYRKSDKVGPVGSVFTTAGDVMQERVKGDLKSLPRTFTEARDEWTSNARTWL